MSNVEDQEDRDREREDFLVAFYELTKDQPLRWSSHRAVAAQAGISDDRMMVVSQDLAGRGLIEFRTMGGPDGQIELIAEGVSAAERIIGQRAAAAPTPSITLDAVLEADSAWAARYRPLLELGINAFLRDGLWPDLDVAQRALDRDGYEIDVREALRDLPLLPGETRALIPVTFELPLRMFRYSPSGAPLLDYCVTMVKRAVDLYFSDAEDLEVTSDDLEILLLPDRATARTAALLLLRDYPSPFAGGGHSPDGSWTLAINGATARRFQGIKTFSDYLQRQLELRLESQNQLARLAATDHPDWSTPESAERAKDALEAVQGGGWSPPVHPGGSPVVFVVMPFGESWSTGVYDFIRRAVRSLGYSDSAVVRADTITKPGRIDQQILETIDRADAVVGDITGKNANVMWELGYAEASQVPVVIMNQAIEESPFDLVNARQVLYRLAPTDEDEHRLAEHIQSALKERGSGIATSP